MNGAPSRARSGRALSVPEAAGAVTVLAANWSGAHTLPSGGLYPHQWSWDSAFIAFGLRRLSPRRAGRELDDLFAAQWADGRIPQIVYDPRRDEDYAPGNAFWRSTTLPASSLTPTAGLVQPPNHAWAVLAVHESDPEESARRGFLARAYPRLLAWHRYLETRRVRGGRGLAAIVHPWESGTDNSPLWDDALARVPTTAVVPHRPDLAHATLDERPGARDYRRYYWLAERYRDNRCDDVDPGHPFLLEDPCFNALWVRSELALAQIAENLGEDPEPRLRRAEEITAALGTLWDEQLGLYVARDVVTGDPIGKAVVNGLVPLVVPGVPHAARLVETLLGDRFLGSGAFLPPSYDATAPDFAPSMYWRGPAWFNMTWLLATGLRGNGEVELADTLLARLASTAAATEYSEYVNPFTCEPHGTRSFSWTAALTLDALALLSDHPTNGGLP